MQRPLYALLLIAAVLLASPAAKHANAHEDNEDGDAQHRQYETSNQAKAANKPVDQASDYKTVEMLGWSLCIHDDLLADEDLYQQTKDEIHHQLFRITRVVPADKVKHLKKVLIWVDKESPLHGTCQYHPSQRWLERNGYLPDKAKCIDIGNAKSFLNITRTHQPFVLLHELSHAFHDQQLGFDHKEVIDSYNTAMETGNYEKVMHINGRQTRHYATTNHKEYFAEATEAYFGTNDFYPFVRPELKQHDPAGFSMMQSVWGKK